MVATYVVHVIDESLMGGSFVEKVREHWWPEYCWTKFFWFNAGYFAIIALIVLMAMVTALTSRRTVNQTLESIN